MKPFSLAPAAYRAPATALAFALLGLVTAPPAASEVSTEAPLSGDAARGFCLFCGPAGSAPEPAGHLTQPSASFPVVLGSWPDGIGDPLSDDNEWGSQPGQAPLLDTSWEETPSQLRPLHRRLALDIWDLARRPAHMERRHWLRLGAGVLAVGAVSLLDDEIRNTVRSENDESQAFANSVRPIGQQAGLAVLGVSWFVGKAFDRPRLRAIATDGFEATLISAGLITPLLKDITGRSRPRHNLGSRSFSGSESFPSGEVTEAFAIASVVAAHAERKWVKGVAWGLAGLTAWQRIELDGHWSSDVLAGALIGTSVGRWVVRRNRPRLGRDWDVSVAPLIGDRIYGVGFSVALGGG